MTNIFELNALTIFKSAVVSRRMMTYLAMVFLMITTGPGGTHHLNLEVRTAFWIVWTTAIWLTTFVVFQGFMSWRKTEGWPSWSNTAVIFAIVLIPCSVLSNGITSTMFPLFFNFNIESIVIAGIFVAPILIVMLLEFHVTQGTERSELALPCESKQFFNRHFKCCRFGFDPHSGYGPLS